MRGLIQDWIAIYLLLGVIKEMIYERDTKGCIHNRIKT